MGSLERFGGKQIGHEAGSDKARLTLYDQYGAMAYGVITQILPQPDVAQTVLVNLFASAQMDSLLESSTNKACAIVRLARLKALEAKPVESPVSIGVNIQSVPNDKRPKLIFDLLFNRGFRPEAIAERLEMTYWDVLKAMREHVKSMLTR